MAVLSSILDAVVSPTILKDVFKDSWDEWILGAFRDFYGFLNLDFPN